MGIKKTIENLDNLIIREVLQSASGSLSPQKRNKAIRALQSIPRNQTLGKSDVFPNVDTALESLLNGVDNLIASEDNFMRKFFPKDEDYKTYQRTMDKKLGLKSVKSHYKDNGDCRICGKNFYRSAASVKRNHLGKHYGAYLDQSVGSEKAIEDQIQGSNMNRLSKRVGLPLMNQIDSMDRSATASHVTRDKRGNLKLNLEPEDMPSRLHGTHEDRAASLKAWKSRKRGQKKQQKTRGKKTRGKNGKQFKVSKKQESPNAHLDKKHLNILGKHHPYDKNKTGYTGKSGVMGDKQELPSYDWLVGKKAVDPTQVSGRTWKAKEKTIKKAILKNLLAHGHQKQYVNFERNSDKVLDEYLPLVGGQTRKELGRAADIANLLFQMSPQYGADAENWLNGKTDTEYGGLNRLGRENLVAFYGGEDFDDDAFKEDNGITIDQALYGNQDNVDWGSIMHEISDGAYFSSGMALEKMMDGEGWDAEFLAGANDGLYDY